MRSIRIQATTARRSSDRRKLLGERGERAAADFLAGLGMQIVQQGFRCRAGEIDLIARDGPDLVFVEVKTRSTPEFGDGSEAVTRSKRRRILRAASLFLSGRDALQHPCRFDVITVRFDPSGAPRLEHLRDAFGGDR